MTAVRRALALMLCMFALAGAARAQDVVVGKVLAVRGDVVALAGRERTVLAVDMQLRSSHVIVAATGKARIELVDGTLLSVGENSRVRIAEVAAPGATPATRAELISGALRLLVVKATPAARFEVETETAIAAVRGTDWAVEATAASTGVVVLTGSVDVTSRTPARATVRLDRPEAGTDVPRGGVPTPPTRWGPPRLAALLARTSID